MKEILMMVIVLLLAVVESSFAHADADAPVYLASRPAWMAKDLPTAGRCPKSATPMPQYQGDVLYDCRVIGGGGALDMEALLIAQQMVTDGQRVWSIDLPSQIETYCDDTYCKSGATDDIHVVSDGSLPGRTRVWSTRGYYVVIKGGSVITYRTGTGPYGHLFKPYVIYGEPMEAEGSAGAPRQPQPPASTGKLKTLKGQIVQEAWCNPLSDYCSLTIAGKRSEYAKDKLGSILPRASKAAVNADGAICEHQLCFDTNNKPIGLAPDYQP